MAAIACAYAPGRTAAGAWRVSWIVVIAEGQRNRRALHMAAEHAEEVGEEIAGLRRKRLAASKRQRKASARAHAFSHAHGDLLRATGSFNAQGGRIVHGLAA